MRSQTEIKVKIVDVRACLIIRNLSISIPSLTFYCFLMKDRLAQGKLACNKLQAASAIVVPGANACA
jgi:hypothetical protein